MYKFCELTEQILRRSRVLLQIFVFWKAAISDIYFSNFGHTIPIIFWATSQIRNSSVIENFQNQMKIIIVSPEFLFKFISQNIFIRPIQNCEIQLSLMRFSHMIFKFIERINEKINNYYYSNGICLLLSSIDCSKRNGLTICFIFCYSRTISG